VVGGTEPSGATVDTVTPGGRVTVGPGLVAGGWVTPGIGVVGGADEDVLAAVASSPELAHPASRPATSTAAANDPVTALEAFTPTTVPAASSMMERPARPGTDLGGDQMTDVQDRLAGLASRWASAAADVVPTLPVRPASAASFEPHLLSTICVEVVLPMAATAPRWDPEKMDRSLGRIAMKLRHMESLGKKAGRDIGMAELISDTQDLLEELKVRSTIGKHEGKPPPAWYESSVGADEAVLAERALRSLSDALALGDGGSLRTGGSLEYRFRDGPGVLAFWSMKVEVASPGITQKFSLRLGRGRQAPAIADALDEFYDRLDDAPGDVVATDRHTDLVALCELSLRDLGRDPLARTEPEPEDDQP
jgi:hypothetical protein